MGTGRLASGFTCPSCMDLQRQDVLDMRVEGDLVTMRLLCAKCERVWRETVTMRTVISKTSDAGEAE
mgnify:CR=1 FL=1